MSENQPLAMGCLPRVSAVGDWFPVAGGDDCPKLPRAEWATQAGNEWVVAKAGKDVNQTRYNSCAIASLAWLLKFDMVLCGRPVVEPDWYTLWSKLTRGRNVGVGLDTALQEIVTNGFPIVGSNDKIVVKEYWDAPDYDSYVSGILRGCRGTHGRFIGRQGHAEFDAYAKVETGGKVTFRVRGTWGADYPQSENGWYDVPGSDIERGLPTFGAILIRAVELLPGDVSGMEDAKA
jgi:hypothetical protein